ncbi:hypothetical protein HYW76_00065 [Candidatus Pacearchaeota archaeon]|nr:hypothetical protein [Candidatus Pacearchaeota archaeon]
MVYAIRRYKRDEQGNITGEKRKYAVPEGFEEIVAFEFIRNGELPGISKKELKPKTERWAAIASDIVKDTSLSLSSRGQTGEILKSSTIARKK